MQQETDMPELIVLCFSGGKDSTLALQAIQQEGRYHIAALLTTITSEYDRVSMHGVRRVLLHQQAASLGLPLTEVAIPPRSSNAIYERAMRTTLDEFRAQGIRHVAFGDIFLEDLRAYREHRTAACGLACLFPIWKRDTAALARRFIDDGFKAVVVCVDPKVLDAAFAGRPFDDGLLADLPVGVDPCGENGEFHTFVWGGPVFRHPVPVSVGPIVERDGFVYCDVRPNVGAEAPPRRFPRIGVTR